MLKAKTSCGVYVVGKETAGIYILFGGMTEDVLFVRHLPFGEKNLCICVQLKRKRLENLESQGLSSVTLEK